MIQKIKENYLMLSIMGVIFIIFNIYIFRSTDNIVFSDQLRILDNVDKFFDGNLKWSDLWEGYLEHRTPGYHILVLLNALFFHYNTQLEAYLGSILILGSTIVLYFAFKDSIRNVEFKTRISSAIFGVFVIIMFSLNQWEIITFSVGFYIFLKGFIFMAGFYFFNLILLGKNDGKLIIILFFMSLVSSILLFAGGYSPGFIGSIILVGGYSLFIKDTNRKYNFKILVLTIFISIASYLIYINGLEGSSLSSGVLYVLKHPLDAFVFVTLSLSGSLIGVESANHYLSSNIMVFIGSCMLAIYIITIYIFHKFKLYRYSLVPLLLMVYSLLSIGLFLVGRLSAFGVTAGLSSRYTTETQLGLIGCIWILTLFMYNSNIKPALKKIIIVFIVGSTVVLSFSNLYEWKLGVYRKAYFNDLSRIALDYKNYPDSELAKFQAPIDKVKSGIEILKKHNLNVFYENTLGSTMDTGLLGPGFYSKENGSRWVGDYASGTFRSGKLGELQIQGIVPEILGSLKLCIYANDIVIYNGNVEGSFLIKEKINPNSTINLRIVTDKSFVPKEDGESTDERNLSFVINKLVLD